MKARAPTIDRISRWVAVLASTWFAFAASWGMFGIPGGGHIGAGGAGNVMAAEQMIKWKIIYPAWDWYSGVRPVEGNYLCHHPFGQYYVPAVLYWLFGHHDVLVHLPATLMSAAIPPMLYGIGKERWGAPAGAVAAAGYVVRPDRRGVLELLEPGDNLHLRRAPLLLGALAARYDRARTLHGREPRGAGVRVRR